MKYKIIKSWRKTISLKVKDWQVIVKAPYFVLQGTIDNFVNKNKKWIEKRIKIYKNRKTFWEKEIKSLKIKAKKYIPNRVEEIARDFWLRYNKIKITSAKTRWGSCTSKRNLNFTYRLILTPKDVIDYVIIHELAHLKHMNHSESFWKKVWEMMPNYKKYEKWLKIEWIKFN